MDSTTTLVFTRPLSPLDTDKEAFSALQGDVATFIWGYGKDNTLDTHSHDGRGTAILVDLFCGEAVEEDDKDDDTAGGNNDGSAGGNSEDSAGGNKDDSAGGSSDAGADPNVNAASTGVCVSSDPDYEFEISPRRGLSLLWSVMDEGTSVKVKVRSRTMGIHAGRKRGSAEELWNRAHHLLDTMVEKHCCVRDLRYWR